MQEEFEKAIPHLTISKDAMIQAKLEEAEAKLKNIPTMESLQQEMESLRELVLEKSIRVKTFEEKAKRLPPPKIEDADKKGPAEVLLELQEKRIY